MRYDAIVFDNDGVLTTPTSEAALRRAMDAAFDAVGVDDPTEGCIRTLRRPDVPSLRELADEYGVTADELWRARERAAIDVQLEELRAGNKRLYDDVDALGSLETPRAIVSNNQHETIDNIVDHFGLAGFDPYYGREPTLEGIRRKKPEPHYLERAIGELGCSNPLYVGDSRVDVAAAEACGVDSAFVRRDHRDGYALETDPTHEIASLESIPDLVAGRVSGSD